MNKPDLTQEKKLWSQGYRLVAGLDEAGRGAWAGPVYAAAVILPPDQSDPSTKLSGVTDSKRLTAKRRTALLPLIHAAALAVGVGSAEPGEIDALGIAPAVRLAMQRAIAQLSPAPDALLIDYIRLPEIPLPQHSLPKADLNCLSVAAASIVAKVSRDRQMVELDAKHPGYGLAQHKGYGTAMHREALVRLGPNPLYRMSWSPLQSLNKQSSDCK